MRIKSVPPAAETLAPYFALLMFNREALKYGRKLGLWGRNIRIVKPQTVNKIYTVEIFASLRPNKYGGWQQLDQSYCIKYKRFC
jgi:hypothetical protein